jgi:release factor glutamine methyltransferase
MMQISPITVRDSYSKAQQILAAAGCDTPALDAELLAAQVLGMERSQLWLEPDRAFSESQLEQFNQLTARRQKREPLPYILGEWEFYGLRLEVTPAVLIPRPETETLIEVCLARLSTFNSELSTVGIDVGTGSGAIAIALAHNLPSLHMIATESSEAALAVAQCNILHHNLQNQITLLQGDLLGPLKKYSSALPGNSELSTLNSQLTFIAANLPYIPTDVIPALQPEVRDWEPRPALDGGPDGLVYIRQLISQARDHLKPGGFIALEISPEQAEEVKRILALNNFGHLEIVKDLAGKERVITACP